MKTVFKLREVDAIPQTYGVYLFLDKNNEPIYIGKSVNLKKRLLNHLQNPYDQKTIKFVSIATTIKIMPTQNEFEAIILEAKLIKRHQPPYNIELKDDKGLTYISISDSEWPMVKLIKKPTPFGPYLKNNDALSLLRYIRQIIPFATHKPQNKVCVYHELGLCNPCPSQKTGLSTYLANIQKIQKLLSGQTSITRLLARDIKRASGAADFERAQRLFKLQEALTNQDSSREIWDFDNHDFIKREQKEAQVALRPYFSQLRLSKVECFDASHHWGKYLYVGMVVFKDGLAQKADYRLFTIKTATNDDPKALGEALTRRVKHLTDWGKPDLVVIDGGTPQLSVIGPILERVQIPYLSLAKKEEILHIPQKNATLKPTGALLTFMTRVRDEAHRFSITKSRQAFRKKTL